MVISQADRAEMYESFKAVVGVKSTDTLFEELAARDNDMAAIRQDIRDIVNKINLLVATNEVRDDAVKDRFRSIESQLNGIHNWVRGMVIGFLGFGATVLVTVIQMR